MCEVAISPEQSINHEPQLGPNMAHLTDEEVAHLFVGRFSAAKYHSTNPISRLLVRRFLGEILALVSATRAGEVHEIGCGEGQITGLLARRGILVRGSDVDPEALEVARSEATRQGLKIDYAQKSVYELAPSTDAAQLIMCCEVLEHLSDPEAAMRKLVENAKEWLILSVPSEPLWRILNICRLQYLPDLGNTPGHLNHWSPRSFVEFVSQFIVVNCVRTPVPWTLVCGRPHSKS